MHRIKPYLSWYASSVFFLTLFLLPLYKPAWFANPLFEKHAFWQGAAQVVLITLTPLATWLALKGNQLEKAERKWAWFLVLCATAVCEVVHYWAVDRGHYLPVQMAADNTAWQLSMHKGIMALDPNYLPHSYRFLPDCIVTVFNWLSGSFELARIAYRLLFDAAMFVAVYRFARVYVSNLFAGGVVVVVTVLYPVSVLKYAGQFVDPASHFSFALCLFCFARNYEPPFGVGLFAGLFAKESVIVMSVSRFFMGSSRLKAIIPTAIYVVVSFAIALGIRLAVNRGHMSYGRISGVDFGHAWDNLKGYREWGLLYLASFGSLLPGTLLGWKLMDRSFHYVCLLVVLSVIVSSVFFSWLAEVRNMVPAFIVLAVVNMRYLESVFASPSAHIAPTGGLDSTARG